MGPEARTRIALISLLGFIVISYAQVFVEGPYPGPTLLAIGLAMGLAVISRRVGVGALGTLLMSGTVLLVYLTVIFESSRSLYLLPTPDALAHLWRSVLRAASHSQIDYAPVPVRGGYVIAVVVGFWFATTWAEIATFRWRQPLLAALPAIILFSAVLVVGTGTAAVVLVLVFLTLLGTFWATEAAERLGSWGRWVATWDRQDGRAASVYGRLARRMVASCLVSAVVVPLAIPSIGRGLIGWRSGQGNGSGQGGGTEITGRIDPFVQLAPTLISQSDETLFTVQAEVASYWRLVSLSNFDGERWRLSPAARLDAPTGTLNTAILPQPELTESLRQVVEVELLRGSYLPAATTPFTIDLGSTDLARLRVHPETGDLLIEDGMEEGMTYEVWSSLPKLTYQQLREAQPGDPGFEYTALPQLSPRVVSLLEEWTAEAETPGEKLIAIQQRLRGFEYKLPTPEEIAAGQGRDASADYLTEFLTTIRAGYCQQFATAFALLARKLGYPSRVSVGFLAGEAAITGTDFTVRGTDAHAWPEVYMEGYGWVPFEPTPRSAAAQPTYTLSPIQNAPNFQAPDAEIFNPSDPSNGTDPRLGDVGEAGGGGDGGGPRADRASKRVSLAWVKTFNRLLIGAGAIALFLLLLLPLMKEARIAVRFRRARSPGDTVAAAFAHFQEEAGAFGYPRPPGETATSFAARVASGRKIPRPTALRLASLFDEASFAPAEPATDEAREARGLARRLRGSLWGSASWLDRARRLWSPRVR